MLPKRQIFPSPQYPCLHVQLYDPLVLLHTASALQLDVPSIHSFMSARLNLIDVEYIKVKYNLL